MKARTTCAILSFLLLAASAAFGAEPYTGRVFGPSGKALAGATVKLLYIHDATGYGSQWLAETRSDTQGDFTLAMPEFTPSPIFLKHWPGTRFCLVAVHPDYAMSHTPLLLAVKSGYSLWLDVKQTITAKVLDVEGAVIKGAKVTVREIRPDRRGLTFNPVPPDYTAVLYPLFYCGVTDEKGAAEFDNLPIGLIGMRAVELSHGAGYKRPEDDIVTLTLSFQSYGTVKGKVVRGETDGPIAGAVIWDKGSGEWALSEADGHFACLTVIPIKMGQRSVYDGLPGVIVRDATPGSNLCPEGSYGNEMLAPGAQTTVRLLPGKRYEGKVTDSATHAGVPGVLLEAHIGEPISDYDSVPTGQAYLLTDKDGSYAIHARNAVTSVGVSRGPYGTRMQPQARKEKPRDLAKTISTRPLKDLRIRVLNADATPACGAGVAVSQRFAGTRVTRTDHRGIALIGSLDDRERIGCYAQSLDGRSATCLVLEKEAFAAAEPAAMTLGPSVTGHVTLVGPEQQKLPGQFYVYWPFKEDKDTVTVLVHTAGVTEKTAGQGLPVPGLVPGATYSVGAYTPDYEHATKPENLAWVPGRDDAAPSKAIAMTVPAHRFGKYGRPYYEKEMDGLSEVTNRWEDPHERQLTWCARKEELTLGDAQKKEIVHFARLLGRARLVARDMAFSPEAAWLGSDEGLFRWDRKLEMWTEAPIADLKAPAAVERLTLTGNKLKCNVRHGNAAMTFEYDVTAGTWLKTAPLP